MSVMLNRWAYQKLVDENIAWLEAQPRTLERDHVIMIVRASVGSYYDPCECGSVPVEAACGHTHLEHEQGYGGQSCAVLAVLPKSSG